MKTIWTHIRTRLYYPSRTTLGDVIRKCSNSHIVWKIHRMNMESSSFYGLYSLHSRLYLYSSNSLRFGVSLCPTGYSESHTWSKTATWVPMPPDPGIHVAFPQWICGHHEPSALVDSSFPKYLTCLWSSLHRYSILSTCSRTKNVQKQKSNPFNEWRFLNCPQNIDLSHSLKFFLGWDMIILYMVP